MRFGLRDFMVAVAVGAAVTAWSIRNAPARFPLIAASAISIAILIKAGLQRPRAGFHRWCFIVVSLAVLVLGAIIGGPLGLRAKEEVRARHGLVGGYASRLENLDGLIDSLSLRIIKSEGRESRDPRHDRWVKDLALARSHAAQVRSSLATYRRLAARPWEPVTPRLDERCYLEPRERDYINRFLDPWGTLVWSAGGAVAVTAVGLGGVLLGSLITSRFIGRQT